MITEAPDITLLADHGTRRAAAPASGSLACCLLAGVLLAAMATEVGAEPVATDAAGEWPAAPQPAVRQMLGVSIPMRDGVELVGDLWLPAAGGPHPVVLYRTPYQRNMDVRPPYDSVIREAHAYARRGIGFLIQDVRGRGESGGEFRYFHGESRDGHDTIEWIARQPWSNGQVAMLGGSYVGTVQWLAARERPPHLTCLFSQAPTAYPFEEVPYIGGAFQLRWAMSWPLLVSGRLMHENVASLTDWEPVLRHRPIATMDQALGRELPLLRQFLRHATLDDWWREIMLGPEHFRGLDLPAFHVTGWYDGLLPGTLHYWRGMRELSAAPASQRLLIGPWNHGETRSGGSAQLNDRERGEASVVDIDDLAFRWFQSCFAGTTAEFDAPPARVFLTGINRWLDLPEYPAGAARQRQLYLHSDGDAAEIRGGGGRLAWSAPAPDGPPESYVFDPRDPVPARGAFDRYQPAGEPRPDVLVYTTPVATEPLAMLGPVDLVLHASTSALDTDFVADLYDVDPAGRSLRIVFRTAVLRARYREGYERQVLMTPHAPTELRLRFFDVGHVLLPGHRLRLEVASSTPGINPNQGTGDDVGTDTRWVRAEQRIFQDEARPSRLELHVIELAP